MDANQARANFVDGIVVGGLENSTGTGGEFDRVDLAFFDGEGTLEIEGHLQWASRDRQADSHWASMVFLAEVFGLFEDKPLGAFGGEPLIHIVTVSSSGDYRYESVTNWDTLIGIFERQVGFDGWVEASGAAFR